MTSVSQIFKGLCSVPLIPPVTAYFFPHFGHGYDSVDGRIGRWAYDSTWPQIRNGAGTSVAVVNYSDYVSISADATPQLWDRLNRLILTFPTNSIPVGAVILEADLRLFCTSKTIAGVGIPTIAIYESWPNAYNALGLADYQNLGDVELSNKIPFADFTLNAFKTIDLLPSGLSKIVPGGVTKLALREATFDGPNIAPVWGASHNRTIWFRMSDYAGTDYDPRLRVKYQPP